MANYFARKAGNINATDVWATTPSGTAADVWSTFTSADVLHSNNFAITVNVATTVGTVRNDNANSATAGGSFTLSNGVTLTANAVAGSTAVCVVFAGTSGNSATLIGNVTGGSGATIHGVSNTSTGTLTITGNCTGGSGTNASGANNNSTGTLTITGNCTGASATGAHGASNNSGGTLTITGNCTGGSVGSAHGASNTSTGTLTITGNCTGGSATNASGANNNSTGTLTITGNCTGGSTGTAYGATNNSTGTLTINGNAIGSDNANGANNASTGILNVTRAIGNDWGIGSVGKVSVAGVNSSVAGAQTRVDELEFGLLGQAPVLGAISVPDKTSNVCLVHRLSTSKKTLFDPSASTGQANEADVRFGTSYALGNKTGTLRVPAAGSVALGVLVDAGSGTAVLTPAAVWDQATSAITASNSIGVRLKQVATVEALGQALADTASAP
jgi:hypothetical protein